MYMKLFLDMDGVLVNWVRGAHELHNLPWDDNNWPYAIGPDGWDFYKNELAFPSFDTFAKDMGYDFWNELEWMPDGKRIIEVCEQIIGKDCVYLLTAPCHTPGTVEGRLSWISREMPNYRNRVLVGDCKEAIAGPKSILVDDWERNVKRWREAGGLAVTCPRAWNNLFSWNDAPVTHIKECLINILDN